jgi:hypothetical protein
MESIVIQKCGEIMEQLIISREGKESYGKINHRQTTIHHP